MSLFVLGEKEMISSNYTLVLFLYTTVLPLKDASKVMFSIRYAVAFADYMEFDCLMLQGLDDTLARANAWFNFSQASSIPTIFIIVQTEQMLNKKLDASEHRLLQMEASSGNEANNMVSASRDDASVPHLSRFRTLSGRLQEPSVMVRIRRAYYSEPSHSVTPMYKNHNIRTPQKEKNYTKI